MTETPAQASTTIAGDADCDTALLETSFEILNKNVRVTVENNNEVSCDVGVEVWSYESPAGYDPAKDQTIVTVSI